MKLSVEISLYPLQDEYIPIINDFLTEINSSEHEIEIRTSNMSTRLFGEFDLLTNLLNAAMKKSMEEHGKVVFVCKYLQGDARDLKNYD